MRLQQVATALVLVAALPAAAAAQGPVPDPSWLWFPGTLRHPSSASSAGVALCDRWLGEAPFDNPAIAPRGETMVTPALVRVAREDLRANNRNMDETPAFLDAAGIWAGTGAGPLALFAYADQPALRLEASAFTSGRAAQDPLGPPPASVALDLESREVRVGAGVSFGSGPWRAGVAGEWTRHRERTEVTVESGAPTGNGTTTTELTGSGFGAQAGARMALDLVRPQGLVIGAAARWIPRLEMDGAAITVARARGWEAGVSARALATESVALLAAFGGSGETTWDGLGVRAGPTIQWGAAFEYHDPEEPWTARLGWGEEAQDHVAESRAGRLGLGFGWAFGGTTLDVAVMRRNLQRSGNPDSYDDRVLASVRVRF